MAEPDYDAMIAEYGFSAGKSVARICVRTHVLYRRLPTILANVRRWLRERGATTEDGSGDDAGESTEDGSGESEDVSCTMEFPDAWYRSAVVGVERATEERRQVIADMNTRPWNEDVIRPGRKWTAGHFGSYLARRDGFECIDVRDPIDRQRNGAYNRVVPGIVRYMRTFLKASMIERAVVITMIRDNIADLVCHPPDDVGAVHNWIALYEHPVVCNSGVWSRTHWTDNQDEQWAAAFKKRFTTPEPYMWCNDNGNPTLTMLSGSSEVRKEVTVFGIEVLLRAGIDPSVVVDRTGWNVITVGMIQIFPDDMAACRFLDKIRAVYAKHPKFRFDALLNARCYAGNTLATRLLRSWGTDANSLRLLLYLCTRGLDVEEAIAGGTEPVWRTLQTVLAEARAAGLPGNTIITMIWDVVHLPEPNVRVGNVPQTCKMRLRRTCKPIDIGMASSFIKALNFTFVECFGGRISAEPKWFMLTKQGVVNAMRCYPWWSPGRHRFHTQSHRACVTAVLLSAHRLDGQASRKCGRLPAEMWFAILSFLPDSRLPLVK